MCRGIHCKHFKLKELTLSHSTHLLTIAGSPYAPPLPATCKPFDLPLFACFKAESIQDSACMLINLAHGHYDIFGRGFQPEYTTSNILTVAAAVVFGCEAHEMCSGLCPSVRWHRDKGLNSEKKNTKSAVRERIREKTGSFNTKISRLDSTKFNKRFHFCTKYTEMASILW